MNSMVDKVMGGLGWRRARVADPDLPLANASVNSVVDDYEEDAMFLPEESLKSSKLVIRNNPFVSWAFAGGLGLSLLFVGIFVIVYTTFQLWYIGLTVVALGLVLLFSAHADKFVFDARKGSVVFTSVGLFRRQDEEYRLYEIQDVVLTELRDALGGNDYKLHLQMRSGKRLPLLAGHLLGVAKSAKFRAKEKIVEFLLRSTADVQEEGTTGRRRHTPRAPEPKS